jgi:hypothetical protein
MAKKIDLDAAAVDAFAKLAVRTPMDGKTPPVWSDGVSATTRYVRVSKGLYLALDGRRAAEGETGTASWVYRYTAGGKARMLGLGAYPDKSLASARGRTKADTLATQAVRDAGMEPPPVVNADDAIRLRQLGHDPHALRRAAKAAKLAKRAKAVTFKTLAQEYLRSNQVKWKSAKHGKQWEATLESWAYPLIGEMVIGDIDGSAVLGVLQQQVRDEGQAPRPLWEARPETASRLRGRIEQVLDYARFKKLRDGGLALPRQPGALPWATFESCSPGLGWRSYATTRPARWWVSYR